MSSTRTRATPGGTKPFFFVLALAFLLPPSGTAAFEAALEGIFEKLKWAGR